ncbi:MAG: SphA family protein [Syntrophobacteraceae bacterium]
MRRFFGAMCICLMLLTMVSFACANELWDFHERGSDEGLAVGILPPPGLYFINNAIFGGATNQYDNGGRAEPGVKLNGFLDIPILLWTPGCQFLGATYGAAIAQPFDQVTLRLSPPATPATFTGNQWGAYNTVLVPFILSWQVPCHLFVSTSFSIGLNDGTTSPADSAAAQPGEQFKQLVLFSKDMRNAYAWSSNGSYQFTPTLGLSWLYRGWNLSAELAYTFYTKDTDTNYQTGDQFWADYTLTYTWGRWTFGVGAEQQNQVFNDKFDSLVYNSAGQVIGTTGYRSQAGSMAVNYGVGPILGYNFGPCSIMLIYNFPVTIKNDTGSEGLNFRLIIPLGNPADWWR